MKSQYINSVLALIFVSFSTGLWAQKNKLRKAEKQSDNLAYVDAREVYLKVVDKGYTSAQVFESLGDTYYWNSDYVNAAKWYGSLIDQFPDQANAAIIYRAAQANKSAGNMNRANQLMEKFSVMEGASAYLGTSEVSPLPFEVTLKDQSGYNSDYSDFGPAFLGQTMVFSSTRPQGQDAQLHNWTNQPFSKLYQTSFDEQGNVIGVNTLRGAFEPTGYQSTATFTADGKVMYFTQSQSLTKDQEKSDPTMRLKLVRAELMENGEWGNFKDLSLNDVAYSSAHPALSADESKLYFASDRPGGLGGTDLWYAVILGDSISAEPVNLGAQINTAGRETFPFVDANNVLYFASDSYAGMGGLDIYSLDLSDESARITHLSEPVNSPMDDFGLIYSSEGQEGYFASNRGGADSQGDQIYGFRAVCKIAVVGNVYDEETGDEIPGAFVQVFDGENSLVNEFILEQVSGFSFEYKCDQDLRIVATASGYEPNEVILHTPSVSSDMKVPIPLKFKDLCRPNDLGCKLNLQPIYFDFDRYNIRKDAAVELAKILVAMQQYPDLVINIESHTDQRGSEEYNETLSSKRAAATRSWLIEKGVAAERLTARGFGESQPLIDCNEGPCSDDDHQLNRRSVFLVQK
jgi:outer membrane protein OmpA-like peptidoglycan-associated protein